jgi:predicted RNA-binding protein with PIN domain
MKINWLIIDGYNLLHKDDELALLFRSDMEAARHRLIRLIEPVALSMAPQTTIVFDGQEAGIDPALTTKALEVFFAPSNLSADSVIERLACKYSEPSAILVVTSDNAECRTVASAGAQTMSSEEFLEKCRPQHVSSPAPAPSSSLSRPRLGDLFPDTL